MKRYEAAALVQDWTARPQSGGARRIFVEDLEPPMRAGMLLWLCAGCPRTALTFAHFQTLAANSQHAPAWLETCRVLARTSPTENIG